MINPAFIVEGLTEKSVIESLCPGYPIRQTGLNGKHVNIKAIAAKVATIIKAFGNRHYPIIIVIDREERDENCDTILRVLKHELINNGIDNQDVRIGVADRMFENWIIADWEGAKLRKPKPPQTDGLNGYSELRKEIPNFSKTTHSVKMFINANKIKIYNNSLSFKNFIDSIEDLNCNFLAFLG